MKRTLLLLLLWLPLPLHAQQVRVTGVSTVQYVSARALRADSVPIAATTGEGVLRYSATGAPVRCLDEVSPCRYLAAGDVLHAFPLTQDLGIAAWGLGRGIRLQAQLRLRPGSPGDAELWPRAEDRFDAIEAYLEVARSRGRLRLGRQWASSGLGTYSFDGAALQLRHGIAALELYGGWSLLRGLSEPPTSEAVAAIEPFAPDRRAVLLGSKLQLRFSPGAAGSLTYQREVRSDRLGLYSERLSSDAFYRRGNWQLSAASDADLGARELNHLRLQAQLRVRPGLQLSAFTRRYRPYFDQWTIWGAFAPVGFSELGAGAQLAPASWRVSVDVDAASRSYAETGAVLAFAPQRNSGWRVQSTLSTRLASPWSASLRYGTEVGFGAAGNDVALHVRRTLGEGGRVGASATVFDRATDYQLTDGTVAGGGVEAAWPLTSTLRVSGHVLGYRHLGASAANGPDWTQLRGLLQLEWALGSDAGREPRP